MSFKFFNNELSRFQQILNCFIQQEVMICDSSYYMQMYTLFTKKCPAFFSWLKIPQLCLLDYFTSKTSANELMKEEQINLNTHFSVKNNVVCAYTWCFNISFTQ